MTDIDQISEEELERIANFKPAIDREKHEKIEEIASSNLLGMSRRIALVTMEKDADFLSKLSLEEPETFGEIKEQIESFRLHIQGMLELAESALFRMEICDCRGE